MKYMRLLVQFFILTWKEEKAGKTESQVFFGPIGDRFLGNAHPKLWRVRHRKRQMPPEIGLPGAETFGI